MKKPTLIWDPLVRLFHWTLVAGFAANALFLDDESRAHRYVGYLVAALILFRLVWGIVGSRHARFSDFPPNPSAAIGQLSEMVSARRVVHPGHSPLGALMIYNLLLVMLTIAGSGYAMTTDMFWGVDWVEELHETAVTWAEISVVLHILAVFFESHRLGVNLPKSMVTGYKMLETAPGKSE